MFKLSTLAKAKIIRNKKLDTLRLIVAFNVYEQNAKGEYKFPVSKKCDYVSGDLLIEDVFTEIERAKSVLRINDIVLV